MRLELRCAVGAANLNRVQQDPQAVAILHLEMQLHTVLLNVQTIRAFPLAVGKTEGQLLFARLLVLERLYQFVAGYHNYTTGVVQCKYRSH